jgi:RNA polymerase sigma-54 factor
MSENKKYPLSDNKIKDMLKKEGIEIARRTVSKYRESLKIESSAGRKLK